LTVDVNQLVDGTCTEQQYDMTFFSYLEQQW